LMLLVDGIAEIALLAELAELAFRFLIFDL
jgi:hypothetical protein